MRIPQQRKTGVEGMKQKKKSSNNFLFIAYACHTTETAGSLKSPRFNQSIKYLLQEKAHLSLPY